ncbi:MAG: hypothetical protein U0797_27095 [Gemmataceae bacterium]
MEDALVAAQGGKVTLAAGDIDVLLRGTDLLAGLGGANEEQMQAWGPAHAGGPRRPGEAGGDGAGRRLGGRGT